MRTISEEKILTEREAAEQKYTAMAQRFATLTKQRLRNLESNTSDTTVSFSTYDKDSILTYMKSPQANIKNLRNASRQMFYNSIHYRNLISQYALMCPFFYTVEPYAFDIKKANIESILKAYQTACKYLEGFNLKHELAKSFLITFSEGIFYGVIWEGNGSSFIQAIDPDWCDPSSLEDGTYLFSVDMSKIKEEKLFIYPPEFTTMWNEYKKTGQKKQEVPSKICFCLKADETCTYPNIPFVSLLPSIYDLENQKELATVATELENYKLVNYIYATDSDGKPTMSSDFNEGIYNQIANAVPENVGVAMTGKELKAINFERSGTGSQSDDIEQSISNFWMNAGLPVAIEGSPDITASGSILLSLRPEERKTIALLNQAERVINRLLRELSGSQKCRVNMLPVTCYNQADYVKNIKEAATLGIPVKSDYAVLMGVTPTDIAGKAFLENDVLGLKDMFTPLSSSYTESSDDEGGRPTLDSGDVSAEGERARDKASGDNAAGGNV